MAQPTLTPSSNISTVVLPVTGTLATAASTSSYPYGIYVSSLKNDGTTNDLYDTNFITGALEQVSFTYRKLGGDVLDIELVEESVYTAYEEAVLEYSYIVNIHQSKNILHSSLGATTGTFDSDGQRTDTLSGSNIELKFPKFHFGYSKRVMDHASKQVGIGGDVPVYSASFDTDKDQQDYDLQEIVQDLSLSATSEFYNSA